jgi:hypothetical protein
VGSDSVARQAALAIGLKVYDLLAREEGGQDLPRMAAAYGATG